jgi:hypothetical protein
MLKLIPLLEATTPEEGFDNVAKETLKKRLYKKTMPLSRGFFKDDNWSAVYKIFKIFTDLGLDWDIYESHYGNHKYDRTMPMERKVWYFEIHFTNNKGKKNKIHGSLTAAGAGTVEDPLSKYDITVVLS